MPCRLLTDTWAKSASTTANFCFGIIATTFGPASAKNPVTTASCCSMLPAGVRGRSCPQTSLAPPDPA